MSVEGVEGDWILKSNRNAYIIDENKQRIKETKIVPMEVYKIYLQESKETVILFSEPITNDRKTFHKLLLPIEKKLLIGRSEDCDIQYNSKFSSTKHAELDISRDSIKIKNLSNSNGTYINDKKVYEKSLHPGDIVYIIGLKIIIGKGFIMVNNPDGLVVYDQTILRPFKKQQVKVSDDVDFGDWEGDNLSVTKTFFRSPRFKKEIQKPKLKIDPPPAMVNMEETPLMLMLGPSITMGLASLFTGVFALQYALSSNGNIMFAIPTLMMSISMLVGTILWPILTRKHESKKRREREQLRQNKYLSYINEIREEIKKECSSQTQILHENHVDVNECAERIMNISKALWERTHEQNDFLKLRLGLGNLPFEADLKYPEKKFSLEDDHLQDALYKLAEEPKELINVPITFSLTQDWISGIIGNRKYLIDLAKSLVIQLAALHSYDELKLVFIYDKKEHDVWEFVKWLPHVWNKEDNIRFVASDSNEVKEMSAYIESEIVKRVAENDQQEDDNVVTPYYVIFAIDKSLTEKAEMINSISNLKKNYGFSLLYLYDELVNLPKECSLVMDIEKNISKIYDKNDLSGKYIPFEPEFYLGKEELNLAVKLANVQLNSLSSEYLLPNMITFLDMFEVGKVEHLNALTRWKENDPTITLESRIGVDTSGRWFNLDLHEKFHGPHGLIAGMTGSGKSEFIMTFILSLAVNYHPDEVAFILIDYKGGGMANSFSNLPHLAGTITNLDGAAVNRSLISIQSELKRRQAIFSETSTKLDISNIDIYKYQKLYREGKVEEPLQHLFIISDEFAELKTQQPEFMEQLVSAARIGRSLGIHLILATQKPSGVVDDQIWSNSKFRISLKVQEKADSMDVIKRPDAAELSVTGRFYLQVGFNELFEMGQSAWGGAPYYPTDRIEKQRDETVTVIDNLGRIVKETKIDKRKLLNPNPPKQMDEITKYLASIAQEENIHVKPIWLDPIPDMIYLNELNEKYNIQASKTIINPLIGEVDDPVNQRQFGMTFPLSNEGNAIIYGSAGSGKTTFLTTFLYSTMENLTPSNVNVYILDFGAETLRAFSKAPHVGDVLLSDDKEKINNLFKMLYSTVEKRKKLFSDYGGDYQAYIRTTNEEIATIVVVIHNYAGFAETYEEHEEAIAYLTREGLKYGVYFVVTALNTNAIRYRILQNFGQLYVLQLNDVSDYSAVLGNIDGVLPSKAKGRGIYKTDRTYEFQIANVFYSEEDTFNNIRTYCEDYTKQWNHKSASKIPILPKVVNIDYFREEIGSYSENITPIGIEKANLNVAYYDFGKSYINLVTSQSLNMTNFVQGLTQVIAANGHSDVVVLDQDHLFIKEDNQEYRYISSENELDPTIEEMFNLLVNRNNLYKDAKEHGDELPIFDEVTFVIHSLTSLFGKISEDSKEKLTILLEKGEIEYNVNFIISDTIGNLSSLSFDNWYKKHLSLTDGIWIGNGISDQYQLKLSMTNNLYQEVEEGFGYKFVNGKVALVKLLTPSIKQSAGSLVEV
ncbi:type VII secretion protein EssC [Cytobacillus sp. IB215316]|uniref:type VII secretion protein EssC n=1 Tax=Cytobacillus sp. IB215316 TaxID=3097354 RepID=UPI002A0FE06E|nr:type VII secretion protein EssC [Cytobacillus sp. IB215316]MDX8360746.1 type VII secretion protein EssC [Cytobacillus sp. IB215316]